MSTHTAAPWIRAGASGLTRVNITNADQSRVIASVIESKLSTATNAEFGETVLDPEGEANVRLIVCAPELLEALDWALLRIRTSLDTGARYAEAEAVLKRARGDA